MKPLDHTVEELLITSQLPLLVTLREDTRQDRLRAGVTRPAHKHRDRSPMWALVLILFRLPSLSYVLLTRKLSTQQKGCNTFLSTKGRERPKLKPQRMRAEEDHSTRPSLEPMGGQAAESDRSKL